MGHRPLTWPAASPHRHAKRFTQQRAEFLSCFQTQELQRHQAEAARLAEENAQLSARVVWLSNLAAGEAALSRAADARACVETTRADATDERLLMLSARHQAEAALLAEQNAQSSARHQAEAGDNAERDAVVAPQHPLE